MLLGFDLAVLRRPNAGTARYATELRAAMDQAAGDDVVVGLDGWRGVDPGGQARRAANLASDLGWLTFGSMIAAVRLGLDAWFGPANVVPLALPRPKVVTILDANVFRVPSDYDRAFVAYAQAMFRQSARRAAAVLTLSEDARHHLIEDLPIEPGRITVAYPGIDHRLADVVPEPTARRATRYALFVGQTEPHKNVERLVAAWNTTVPRDLDLVIAGPPGRAERAVLDAIAASPGPPRIHRLGSVPEAALAGLYDGASCFVFPSLAEGFGLPPLEAMARGVPTAVAASASLPEVTDGGALIFDPLDVDSIADAVTRLTEDADLRARIADVGRTVAAKYTWARTAATAWRVVRSVVHG
jgi:glycosyltransferase involved in cell wall biosynthesis